MDWWTLGGFVAVNVATAASGGIFTPDGWYRALDKPSWTPPDWLFPPAWTLLFAMIIASGYVFYQEAAPGERLVPLIIYGVQLGFNCAWSALFFGLKRIDLAFVDAVLMVLAIAATIAAFAPASPTAALLLVPYILWVSFAAALTFAILRRNGHRKQPA